MKDGWIAVTLGVLTAAYSWALLGAVAAIPLGLAILIFYLFPLVTTVGLGVIGSERLSWKTGLAIVVALAGLALALDPRVADINVEGTLLAFAAAVGLGIVIVIASRVVRSGDSRPVTLHMAIVAAVLLIALCILNGALTLPNTPKGWIGFVGAAFVYAFAMIAFFISISMIGPTQSSLLGYAEPVAAAALGISLLGETLTFTQVAGIVLVVSTLVMATVSKKRSH